MFMRVADHGRYAVQGRNLLRSPLRVASRDNNFCLGILPLHAANRGPGILVGGSRNRTCVQQNKVGFGGRRRTQASVFELSREGRSISLGSATSKIFDVIGRHPDIVPNGEASNVTASRARGFTPKPCFSAA
jgi:hypothetical protein